MVIRPPYELSPLSLLLFSLLECRRRVSRVWNLVSTTKILNPKMFSTTKNLNPKMVACSCSRGLSFAAPETQMQSLHFQTHCGIATQSCRPD